MKTFTQFRELLTVLFITLMITFGHSKSFAQCQAGFSYTLYCQTVYFTDLSTPVGHIVVYHWNFGDGQISLIPNPTHTYMVPGVYDVMLIIETNTFCTDTVIYQVNIPYGPIADYAFSVDSYSVSFFDLSSGNGGDLVSWFWDFGDPASGGYNTSNLQNPVHIYTSNGTFTTTLTVTDVYGCEDTYASIVEITSTGTTLIASFTVSVPCCIGTPTQFIDQTVAPPGYFLVSWLWDFGDGSTSTLQHPSHTYPLPGSYVVSLEVIADSSGFIISDNTSQSITIQPRPDVSIGASPNPAFLGTPIQFTANSPSPVISWEWDFGDGATSVEENPEYTYLDPGTYGVVLNVIDVNGCTSADTMQVDIIVAPALPEDSTIWNTVGDNCLTMQTWRFRYGLIGDTTISITDLDTSFTYSKVYELVDSTLTNPLSSYFAAIRNTHDNKVYALIPGFEETLLYDFNLQLGDSALFGVGGGLCYDVMEFWPVDHYRIVTAIDSVLVDNGEYRKRWFLTDNLTGWQDIWVDGIGSVNWYGLFGSLVTDMALCGDNYSFACMKEGENVIYMSNPQCDKCFCQLMTSIDNPVEDLNSKASAYPNPFTNEIQVVFTLEETEIVRMNVFNNQGVHVDFLSEQTFNPGTHHLLWDSGNHPSGVYHIRLMIGERAISFKVIKKTDN